MAEQTLTERVLRYQQTGLGLNELVALMAMRIYGYPRSHGSEAEDDGGEFYLFCYPRLLRTLLRFRDRGKPFEWYLHSVLRWQYLAFVRVKRRKQRLWAAARGPEFWDPPPEPDAAEAEAGPPGWIPPELAPLLRLDGEGRVSRQADRRRLLVWALKSVRELDEAALCRLAASTGLAPKALAEAAARLRAGLEPRERRLEFLAGIRDRAFSAVLLLERELGWEPEAGRRDVLFRRLERARRSLRLSQERIARVPLQPSNRDIAEVLGLPKGTVDTSLFWLRSRMGGGGEQEAA